MITTKRLSTTIAAIVLLVSAIWAQEPGPASPPKSSMTISATAAADRVRIAAPASIVQMHVEVYGTNGEKLFDNEIRGGNVFDWHLQDGQAQRLSVGDYVCVVTVKNLAGKITQRVGTVRLGDKEVIVGPAESATLSPAQSQAIGPVEENSSWTILNSKENQTTTVIAHDGTDGQIIRGRGALSFRIGDFFSGKDQEQMRLTEAGNLGIGTSEPKFKLDVAGAIRAREGLVFNDGSTLNVNDKGALTLTNSNGNVVPNASGTGTQNRMAKWTDNSGTLGDTQVSESTGSVVVGNASFTGNLQIFGPATGDVFAGMGPDLVNGPAFNYGYSGASFGRGSGFFNVRPDASAVAPNPSLRFATANVQRMIIDNLGNVGIGTSAPQTRLDVNGVINVQDGNTKSFFGGVSTEVGAQLINFGMNDNRFGGADTSTQGGFLRLDTRAGRNLFQFLGRAAGSTSLPELMDISSVGNVGIGTTTPAGHLHVFGAGDQQISIESSDNGGRLWGLQSSRGTSNGRFEIVDRTAGQNRFTITPDFGFVGIGTTAPNDQLDIFNGGTHVLLGFRDCFPNGSFAGISLGTTHTECSNASLLGNGQETVLKVPNSSGKISFQIGNGSELASLDITNGLITLGDVQAETIHFRTLLNSGDSLLCYRSGTPSFGLFGCGSSSIRYKKNINSLASGLSVIRRLRPVTFDWKEDGRSDFGFVAEEVANVEPLLVTHNNKGQVEGVRYERVGVILVNAIKEQQEEIEQLRAEVRRLKVASRRHRPRGRK